jgi:hypothetical protein
VPDTVEELIALVEADPGRFGPRAPEVVNMLDGIERANGRKESDRAGELLEWIDYWVFYGELSDEVVSVVVPVVEPIADGPANDRRGGDEDDD